MQRAGQHSPDDPDRGQRKRQVVEQAVAGADGQREAKQRRAQHQRDGHDGLPPPVRRLALVVIALDDVDEHRPQQRPRPRTAPTAHRDGLIRFDHAGSAASGSLAALASSALSRSASAARTESS